VLGPTYMRYIEKSREARDIQVMDGAKELGKAAFVSGDYTYGDTVYYYDSEITSLVPSSYGSGTTVNAGYIYEEPCCAQGEYDPYRDYTNAILELTFTGTSNDDCVVHVHWVNN